MMTSSLQTGMLQQLLDKAQHVQPSLSTRPRSRRPHAQAAVRRSELEIVVGAQQRQIVSNAQLRQQRVDRADLNTCSAASVAQLGGCYMVFAIRLQQRKRCEALDDLLARFRPVESLKQLLENHAGRDDDISAHQCIP